MNKDNQTIETQSAHANKPKNDPFGAHELPIYQTSTFSFDSVEDGRKFFAHEEGGGSHAYTRLGNPTVDRLEEVLAAMEGGNIADDTAALAFGSGMAAITTALLATAAGGTVIAQPALYGCTGQFLNQEAPELGIDTVFVDLSDLETLEETLKNKPNVKVIFAETMANPTMRVCDISAVAELAQAYGVLLMVDNTFGTPYHVRPMELGADVVLHSATKYLNGHGTIIGGALIAKEKIFEEYNLPTYRKNLGGVLGPFEAWLNLNGLKTFALRMERHASNTMKVAQFLAHHDMVTTVYYPGLDTHPDHALATELFEKGYGGVLSFELIGGFDSGVAMMNHVDLCTLAVSLGTVDTLIQHPASMTHSVMGEEARQSGGISDNLVRLAVGIENSEEIISDLEQSLNKIEAVQK